MAVGNPKGEKNVTDKNANAQHWNAVLVAMLGVMGAVAAAVITSIIGPALLARCVPTPPPPTVLPTPTQIQIQLVSLTSPVTAGHDASLSVQVPAGTDCHLTYYLPSGDASGAGGLGTTTAGPDGLCQWRWKIGSTTSPGIGTVSVLAEGATASFEFVIEP